MYELNTTTWFNGNEITITSLPFKLYGAWWQTGTDENGKEVTVKTPSQKEVDFKNIVNEFNTQQAQFRNLA
jgi:hypothetical protein